MTSLAFGPASQRLFKARKAVATCATILLIADIGLFSPFDAAIVALLFALFLPKHTPFLLLTLASIQDAPGLAGTAWYAGFVAVAVLMLGYVSTLPTIVAIRSNYIRKLGLGAIVVVLFALYVSYTNAVFGGLEQAPERSPIIVGGLMIIMVWTGIACAILLRTQQNGADNLYWCTWIILTHALSIALGQILFDTSFMTSNQGLLDVENSGQLSVGVAFGIPRIHGTYLTPNGFALCLLLLMLASRAIRFTDSLSSGFVWSWFILGALLSVLSFSKAILIFVFLTSCFMFIQMAGWKAVLSILAFGTALMVTILSSGIAESLFSAFRISSEMGGESYRALAWHAVIAKFAMLDWVVGTGLSHWPVFFEKNIGVALSDPHTWVLTIPGTFGFPGVLFFFAVILTLVRIAIRGKGNVRAIAFAMLMLLLVKDLFSIPYLFGNTPISFLIWLILALILTSKLQIRSAVE